MWDSLVQQSKEKNKNYFFQLKHEDSIIQIFQEPPRPQTTNFLVYLGKLIHIGGTQMGVHADGGLKIKIFQKFCFGPKSPPKAPFGVKIGASDAENHEESENKFKNFPIF